MTISTIVLVLPITSSAAESSTGKVVSITDGDTIKVMRSGKAIKIRLHGVDCPERKQAYYSVAKQFTSDMVFEKHVTAQVLSKHYDRLVGRVILPDGRCLNEELVRAGLAWWSPKYAPNDKVLANAEKEARAARIGLCQDKEPIPPWEFRKKPRKQTPKEEQGPVEAVDPCAGFNKISLSKEEHIKRFGCPPQLLNLKKTGSSTTVSFAVPAGTRDLVCPCSCINGKVTCAPCARCIPKFEKEVEPVLAPSKSKKLENESDKKRTHRRTRQQAFQAQNPEERHRNHRRNGFQLYDRGHGTR